MAHIRSSRLLEDLRERIAHIEMNVTRRTTTLPFGVPEMDERLPGGGLAYGGIHEVPVGGTVDGAAAIAARTRGWRPHIFSSIFRRMDE